MSAPKPSHLAKLARLRDEAAGRVLERAAIIAEACGVDWDAADKLAYELEAHAQTKLPGVP